MNVLNVHHRFRTLWLALLAAIMALPAAGRVRAAETSQSSRFLLVFETSSAMKRDLPIVRLTIDKLFSGNLQNEIKTDDDVAIWTVDEKLHTGTYPLVNWAPEEAGTFADQVETFLADQKYSRHASLAAIQPLLNRVVKYSDRLTVLIFCDSDSVLSGTPYDSGVNDIITSSVAKTQGAPKPFIIVLRAYHGEYLGCSVNRSAILNFPKFPPPPKPKPAAPVVQPAAVASAPPPPLSGPIVQPVPAMIIVGTKASTNVADLATLTAAPVPAPPPPPPAPLSPPVVTNVPATNAAVSAAAVPPAPAVVATPPVVPAPVAPAPAPSVPPAPAPVTAPAPAAASEPANPPPGAATQPSAPEPAGVVPANPPPFAHPSAPSLVVNKPTITGSLFRWAIIIGAGALLLAVGIFIGLLGRARQPQGSLITRSMQVDLNPPPESAAPEAAEEPLPPEPPAEE